MRIWYAYVCQKIIGPFSKEEVILKIKKGGISPTDFISLGVKNNWKYPTEWSCFPHALFPCWQLVEEDLIALKKSVWIALVWDKNGNQYLQSGPYSVEVIKKMLLDKKINLQTYLWKQGLTGWVQAKHRPEFSLKDLPSVPGLAS